MKRLLAIILLLVCGLGPVGCFSFSGPSDIVRQLEADAPIEIEKEHALTVGPLGIAFASAIAGDHIPMSLEGLSSVDFGMYTVHDLSAEPYVGVPIHGLEERGWERVARVRDSEDHIVVLTWGSEENVRRMLVLHRDKGEMHIVRVTGNFEKLLDNLADSEFMDDMPDFCGTGGKAKNADDEEPCEVSIACESTDGEPIEGCPSCTHEHIDLHVDVHLTAEDDAEIDEENKEEKPERVVTWD